MLGTPFGSFDAVEYAIFYVRNYWEKYVQEAFFLKYAFKAYFKVHSNTYFKIHSKNIRSIDRFLYII